MCHAVMALIKGPECRRSVEKGTLHPHPCLESWKEASWGDVEGYLGATLSSASAWQVLLPKHR